jgi:hypothetical protein
MNQNLKIEIVKHLTTLTNVSRETDQQSEKFLMEDALKNPEYVQTLMALSMDETQSDEIRLKSVLILKRALGYKRGELQGNQEEIFRANCLDCLTLCNNMKIGKNFAEVIYNTMLKYYPAHWPDLDNKMISMFQSVESIEKLFWILTGFYNLSKVREHSIDDAEIHLKNQSINNIFPKIEEFLVNLINNEMTKQSAMILRLISKIFCKSIRYNLPLYLVNQEKNALWMGIIGRVFQLPHTNSEFAEDILSAKKWFSRALVTYFRKYAKIDGPQAEEYEKQFAVYFTGNFVLPLINILVECLKGFKREHCERKEDKFALNIMRCLMHCLRNKMLDESVVTTFQQVANELVIPSLKFNQDDKEIYEDDPNEYFKRNDDFLSSVTYREGALSFLSVLIDLKPEFFQNLFTKKFSDPNIDATEKEVFYHVLEKTYDTYRSEAKFAEFICLVFKNCLSRDLTVPLGFLQMRCCRVIYRFVSYTVPVEALSDIYKSVCSLMEHNDLPVRCCAALAFNSMLSKKEMTELVRPHLKDILIIFVKLIRNIENDTLINSLKNIFVKFKNEIQPYVEDLCQTIVEICMSMYQKNQQRESNDVEVDEFAFMSGISSVEYLIEISTDTNTLIKIMDIVYPLVELVIKDMGLESFEESVSLVSNLCAKLPGFFHPKILHIFQYFLYGLGNINLVRKKIDEGFTPSNLLLTDVVMKDEENFIEFTSCISTFFRNVIYNNWMFIYKEKDSLGNNYLELLYQGINNSIDFKMELTDNTNKVCLSMLLSTLVVTAHKYTPKMLLSSSLLSNSIQIVLKIINEARDDVDEESNMKVYQNCLLHNIGICLFANPEVTIKYLESNNLTEIISDNLVGKFSELMTYRTIRTYFMGMCNLIVNRSVVSNPALTALLNNPEILVYFNRLIVKLSLLKSLNSFNDDIEIDELGDDEIPGLDTEINKMLSKFEPDPALENLESELCRTDMDYLLHVEVLMAFDYDICKELVDEIDEIQVFKNLLNKESAENTALFQGYVSGTSEGMKKNVQIVLG